MSKGMIWGAMGQAVSRAGSDLSSQMMQGNARDEANALRIAERDEQRQFQAEQNALYRKPADMMSSGGRGGSNAGPDGFKLEDLRNGTDGGGLIASMAGMTEPEIAQLENAQKTGNFDAFKTGKRSGEYGAAGPEQMSPEQFEAARATYPPGVSEQTIRAKFVMLGNIKAGLAMGSDNKSYAEGERTRQEIGASDEAMRKPGRAGIIAQGMAAGSGDGAFGKGNVNEFSGAPDAVGNSMINENNAQAAKARRVDSGGSSKTDANDLKSLSQERTATDSAVRSASKELADLRSATKNVPFNKRDEHQASIASAEQRLRKTETRRDEVIDRLRARSTKPAAEAASAPTATPRRGVYNPATKKIEYK